MTFYDHQRSRPPNFCAVETNSRLAKPVNVRDYSSDERIQVQPDPGDSFWYSVGIH